MKRISVSPTEQLQELKYGCAEIIAEEELLKKLQVSYDKQTPLIVKFGADPSRPDLHLGHSVPLSKLRQFQNFGHQVKFIIGDFTARIGDPTGKNKTRPQLTKEEVEQYAVSYKEQVFKILDPSRTDVVYNSHWLDTLTPTDFVRLMAGRTVQQLLARDDFSTRYGEGSPIYLHEFVYPIVQGFDSVHLMSDIEMGGTDQKFNLLLAREMQRAVGQAPQCVVLMPLLEGLDGVQKMSKSYDNYIGIDEPASEIFGKTMSISDEHMIRFYELLSRKGRAYIEGVKERLKSGEYHPMQAKKALAFEMVENFWGNASASEALANFEKIFSKKEVPEDLQIFSVTADGDGLLNILDISVQLGFSPSKGDARRVLKQNGMKKDDEVLTQEKISVAKGTEFVFKQGKLKFAKIRVI